jgi:DNA polymerase-3 subunit delta'
MVTGTMPHALLLAGPASVGKTTLALDIAAALLCADPSPANRPCRACRSCHLVDAGNHPDLHRVAPEGPGRLITIDAARRLLSDLALLPAEGGARVAVLEAAHRMSEDAQNAVLKTLEEPPAGVALVLCADDEERLLPTIRSRCARTRLGPVAVRDVEGLLEERHLADAPTGAKLARIAAGRPGLAVAYARAPDAIAIRGEIARSLLDLVSERPGRRLALVRELASRAGALAVALDPPLPAPAAVGRRSGRSRGYQAVTAPPPATPSIAEQSEAAVPDASTPAVGSDGAGEVAAKAPPSERRKAALMLLEMWRDLARDLALVASGDRASVRDPGLLEELEGVAVKVRAPDLGAFLGRLARVALVVDGNANPELALDALVLEWPHAIAPA